MNEERNENIPPEYDAMMGATADAMTVYTDEDKSYLPWFAEVQPQRVVHCPLLLNHDLLRLVFLNRLVQRSSLKDSLSLPLVQKIPVRSAGDRWFVTTDHRKTFGSHKCADDGSLFAGRRRCCAEQRCECDQKDVHHRKSLREKTP